jgi:hypothetical protein
LRELLDRPERETISSEGKVVEVAAAIAGRLDHGVGRHPNGDEKEVAKRAVSGVCGVWWWLGPSLVSVCLAIPKTGDCG